MLVIAWITFFRKDPSRLDYKFETVSDFPYQQFYKYFFFQIKIDSKNSKLDTQNTQFQSMNQLFITNLAVDCKGIYHPQHQPG